MTRWTSHYYVSADNSLRSTVPAALEQFRTTDPKKIQVVVQVDLPEQPAQRYVLNGDGEFVLLESKSRRNGSANTGDPKVFKNFLIAARHLRRRDRTMVVLNGHGTGIMELRPLTNGHQRPSNGPRGAFALGLDRSSNDYLDNHETETVLKEAFQQHKKPDILGYDACLMAMVEIAHQLRKCASFFIASQDNETAAGWPYQAILRTFDDEVEPKRAAINIVRTYGAATKEDKDATLSAVALDQMDLLADALDQFGATLRPFVVQHIFDLARCRQKARVFANFDSIDLHEFVDAVKARFFEVLPDGIKRRAILEAADAVLAALSLAVVATSRNPVESGANGLAVYLPNTPVIDAYHDLPLSKEAPRWYDFVTTYAQNRDRIQGSARTPPVGAPVS
jgi:Clostripain family